MVSASTRWLPWTTMELTVWAKAGRAVSERTPAPSKIPPRSRQAMPSPRINGLVSFIPHAALYRPLWAPSNAGHPRERSSQSPEAAPCTGFLPSRNLDFPHLLPPSRNVRRPLRGRPRNNAQDVVVGREDHQHHHDREPDPESHLLGALRQRLSPDRLDCVEQEVTAIEQRHRKQVEQADRYRDHRGKADQRRKAFARDLPRDLRDSNRSAELIGGLAADEHPADIGECPRDHEPCSLHAEADRLRRADRLEMLLVRNRGAGDAEQALPDHVAETVLDLLESGGRLEGDPGSAAVDLEHQRLPRAGAYDLLHVGEAFDRAAVDRQDQVAGLEPGGSGGAPRLHGVDPRRRARLAEDHEQAGEQRDGENDIRQRPGHHDGGPHAHRLVDEALAALLLAHVGKRGLIGNARRVLVAEELDVAAERHRGNLPAGAVAIVEPEEFRTETDGEHQYPDTTEARDQEMAELVEEYHDGQDEQKWDDVADHAASQRVDAG